jgi:hypothetical protein
MITSSSATLFFCSLASSGTPVHIPFSLPSVEEIVDSFGEAVDAKRIAKRIACAKCIVVKHIRARNHWPRYSSSNFTKRCTILITTHYKLAPLAAHMRVK